MTIQELFAGQPIDWKRTKLIRHNLSNDVVAVPGCTDADTISGLRHLAELPRNRGVQCCLSGLLSHRLCLAL